MPTGRDVHTTKPFKLPTLDEDTLARMRAPPDHGSLEKLSGNDNSSDSENEHSGKRQSSLPGAFPGSSATGSSSDAYF